MSSIDKFVQKTDIAYFTMEIAVRPEMHTYAGGLGILAGDTARSASELVLPMVFVSLVSRGGHFRQVISGDGRQGEEPDTWDPAAWCEPLGAMVSVEIEGRVVWIRPWLYVHVCPHENEVPILLLDTDLEQNSDADRTITTSLYGDGDDYRLKQEIVLGIGGMRMLQALGFEIRTHHMNEGHAALLTVELLNRYRVPDQDVAIDETRYEIADVRERCVFTTHTPVEAGHDRFSYDLFERTAPDLLPIDDLKRLAGADRLNMTRLALNLSGYINGVARKHAETTARMFPGYRIHAITNGVHPGTWTHPAFARLFEDHVPQWLHEPEMLVRAMQIPGDDIWRCQQTAKQDLIVAVEDRTGVRLDADVATMTFARRMTGYKRPQLILSDLERLAAIGRKTPLQIIFAGKAHPKDQAGKDAIKAIHDAIGALSGTVTCVYLADYEMKLAQVLTAGSDIWLNTPLPPYEASGTSGMKAALNGGLNLSVLDGWWIEACIEGVTGWGIDGASGDDRQQADILYGKLETQVLPLYYTDAESWRQMMKQAIAYVAYYFNSQRMMRRYASEAYLR